LGVAWGFGFGGWGGGGDYCPLALPFTSFNPLSFKDKIYPLDRRENIPIGCKLFLVGAGRRYERE
jgi:hypothetical protein